MDTCRPGPTAPPAARRGRPRSEKSRRAVLEATAALMVEAGFDHLTIERIAAEAGVAKQTVYRWWGSKADVVVEAIAAGYLQAPMGGPEDTGDLRADLRRWLDQTFDVVGLGETSRLVRALLAALASASETGEAIYTALIQPIQEGMLERFEAESRRRRQALPATPRFLADQVAGTVLLHVMIGGPHQEDWMDQLLDMVAPEPAEHDDDASPPSV